jgi:hypothetical protein
MIDLPPQLHRDFLLTSIVIGALRISSEKLGLEEIAGSHGEWYFVLRHPMSLAGAKQISERLFYVIC